MTVTIRCEEYEGLTTEKQKVEARLAEYCVKADLLVDMMALVAGEITTAMTEMTISTTVNPKMTAVTSSHVHKKPSPVAQPPARGGAEGAHGRVR